MYAIIINDKITQPSNYNFQGSTFVDFEYDNYIYNKEKYALINGVLEDISQTPEYIAAQTLKEQTRIANLNLTRADVERAIYKVKNMDFEDIVSLLETNPNLDIDLKALKIELNANNFYRGNPYIDAVGEILGFSGVQLDEFFETGDYLKLASAEDEVKNED